MKNPLVVVSRPIPDQGLKMFKKKGYRLKISPYKRPLSKKELLKHVKGADAIVSVLSDTIDKSVVKAAGPQLKIIQNYAVGYNNIKVSEVRKLGVKVGNTPGVLSNAVADMVFALMLTVSRRILEGDEMVRKGKFKGWGPMMLLGRGLHAKTIGIVGLGRIGSEVARRAIGFGMDILYFDAFGKNIKAEKELGITYASLSTLLKKSDFISLNVPLLPSTRHLIDKKAIALMKKSAILINTARGPVIDEKALYRALKKGDILGAGLDVFEEEPKVTPGLTKLRNVVVTPHMASATWRTRCAMSALAAENIIAALTNKKMPAEVLK